jgi:O-antigen/teichoic acid export membrane protein
MAHRAPAPPVYRTGWQPVALARVVETRWKLADPLVRNAYVLIANSGATGVLGLAYWLLTARFYPAAAVGRASAAYVAMNMLAGLTALNFNGALTRFIPQAGRQTRVLVIGAYAVSALASVALAVGFLLTVGWWGPSYSELRGPAAGLAFVGCVVVWAIFTLQDSVLTGLRGAFWVLAENSMFGLVKLVLLVLLVAALPDHAGIYVSWMFPVIVAVPLVNALIFGHLVPRHIALTQGFRPPSSRQIGLFLAGDYSGAMFLLASVTLVPVVVATRVGAASTAYFYVAWLIAGILDMIGISMGMSLTVEGAFGESALAVNCRKALSKMTLLLTPCAAVLALFAPWWLRLFGTAYAAHGARVLELLAVAALPKAVTEVYLGALRAQNRSTLVAFIQAARAAALLGLTVALTGTIGTVGVGVAAVTSQAAIAAAVSFGLWRVVAGDRKRKHRACKKVSAQ